MSSFPEILFDPKFFSKTMMPLSEQMIPVRGPTQLKGPLISPNLKQKPTSINKFTKDFRDILAHKGEASPFSCSLTPEGILGEIVVGVCRPDLQILTLLQTKKCHFSDPFSDLASKIHTSFQTSLTNS